MDHRAAESGLEVVLDNRKLIVAFALLISLCGSFFVVGFIEGKRQGLLEGTESAAEDLSVGNPADMQERETKPTSAGSVTKPLKERSVQEQLDWYKSINRREEGDPGIAEQSEAAGPAGKIARVAGDGRSVGKSDPQSAQPEAAASAKATYSVQVGAFRRRREAETTAQVLQSKGYDCRIEPSRLPEQLFLLKVGKFDLRAEAVAMRLRLKKDGFTSFIKTN